MVTGSQHPADLLLYVIVGLFDLLFVGVVVFGLSSFVWLFDVLIVCLFVLFYFFVRVCLCVCLLVDLFVNLFCLFVCSNGCVVFLCSFVSSDMFFCAAEMTSFGLLPEGLSRGSYRMGVSMFAMNNVRYWRGKNRRTQSCNKPNGMNCERYLFQMVQALKNDCAKQTSNP